MEKLIISLTVIVVVTIIAAFGIWNRRDVAEIGSVATETGVVVASKSGADEEHIPSTMTEVPAPQMPSENISWERKLIDDGVASVEFPSGDIGNVERFGTGFRGTYYGTNVILSLGVVRTETPIDIYKAAIENFKKERAKVQTDKVPSYHGPHTARYIVATTDSYRVIAYWVMTLDTAYFVESRSLSGGKYDDMIERFTNSFEVDGKPVVNWGAQ